MANGLINILDIYFPGWEAFASVFSLIEPFLNQWLIIDTLPHNQDPLHNRPQQPVNQTPEPQTQEPMPNPWDMVLGLIHTQEDRN